jgi:hypothetical protein
MIGGITEFFIYYFDDNYVYDVVRGTSALIQFQQVLQRPKNQSFSYKINCRKLLVQKLPKGEHPSSTFCFVRLAALI